jgi:Ca2+-binding RTX toxin-like protein
MPRSLFNSYDSLPTHGGGASIDFSADPYAGTVAGNGKDIWSPQEAADNLNRAGVNFTFGNNGALDDGVLTFGFWNDLDQVLAGYYGEINEDGYVLTQDSVYLYGGYFAPFTEEQRAMATQNIGLWDDLIAVTFQQVDDANTADITFGFTLMSAAAGAHTYYPQEEALNYYYNFDTAGEAAGDVWANILYQDDFSGPNSVAGGYGWFAITHELGHSLGLSHGGDYNASDDNDGDGNPDPITYGGDAYFYQDSQQYTIMSYFSGRVTGQVAIDWDQGVYAYAQTPAVHDILAVQEVYGADYSTRAGNTVYGFNSTADRAVFDFTTNTIPIVTIWDGGGKDTLDLSGFDTDSIIDINEGAFSSAGFEITDEQRAEWMGILGLTTDEQLQQWMDVRGLGPDGRPTDNIAIAYGAVIENAIGGVGNDVMLGNDVGNRLVGNDGDDVINGGLGMDELIGGNGADTFVFDNLSEDKIRDFRSGQDHIDLSAFAIDASAIKIAGSNLFADTDGNGSYDLHLVVQGNTVQMSDIMFA